MILLLIAGYILFAKYPIYIGINGGGKVTQSKFDVTTAAYVNEKDGCCIYGSGTAISNNQFYINSILVNFLS